MCIYSVGCSFFNCKYGAPGVGSKAEKQRVYWATRWIDGGFNMSETWQLWFGGSEIGGLGLMGLFKDLPVNDSET